MVVIAVIHPCFRFVVVLADSCPASLWSRGFRGSNSLPRAPHAPHLSEPLPHQPQRKDHSSQSPYMAGATYPSPTALISRFHPPCCCCGVVLAVAALFPHLLFAFPTCCHHPNLLPSSPLVVITPFPLPSVDRTLHWRSSDRMTPERSNDGNNNRTWFSMVRPSPGQRFIRNKQTDEFPPTFYDFSSGG